MQTLWRHLREDLVLGNGHLLDQVLRKSGILPRTVHKELGTMLRKTCYLSLQKVDILFSVQRLHCPGVSSKAKDEESCQYTSLQIKTQLIQFIALFFLSISSVSTEQWQRYAKKFEDHQDRTGEPVILVGQSIVLGGVKAEAPLQNEDPMNDQIIWQQYIQQVESLSPENKVSKFCKEAGFMRVVEVGQYFVTKDTGDFRQFQSVACREYTLPRDDRAFQPKGWIQGNIRIGPVMEVTTSFQHFKYGIEIRIMSVKKDDSHSWVRISCVTVKYVIDSIEEENTEIPADPQEEQIPQTSTSVVAARSKEKAKPQPRELAGTTATIPIHQRRWIDIEPLKQDLDSYDLSKKVINLLRHNQTLQREEDGAIEFCKIKFHLRNHHSQIQNWSDDRWKACLAAGGGSKRRYQYCSDDLGAIIYLRALQGHSGSNLIDPTLQDNVLIGTGIFPYIYHVGCTFNLHSIINNGLVPGGQNLSRRQTVFFLPVDPRDESHKDPEYIDFSVPRLARYLHSAWKRHQDAVFWVDIDLAIKEGLTFHRTRTNAIILQGTLPAHCILKVERLKTGEKLYERQYLSPRPPPKISLKHDHNWTIGNVQSGSTVEHQPVGKLVQQSLGEALQAGSSKPTQAKPNPIGDRTGKPVTQEIVDMLQGELGSSDRTGKPVKDEDNRVMNVHDRTGKPVEESSHTKCKKLVLSNIVILHRQTRTSSTLRLMTKTSTSTSPACQMRWWNDHMASTFTTWFRGSRTTLNDKHFKVIFNNIKHSIPSAKNQKMRLWLLGTLNCAR